MKKKRKGKFVFLKKQFAVFIISIVFTLIFIHVRGVTSEFINKSIPNENELYHVNMVIDGDTIKIDGCQTSIRLIGIDAPESVHPDESKNNEEGKQASLYLKNLLKDKKIKIEYDKEKKDKYGRILAYIYIQNHNESVNEMMLVNGYAKSLFISPNIKYKDEFLKTEQIAKKNKIGIWNKNLGHSDSSIDL